MGNCCAGEYDLNHSDVEGNSIKSQPSMDYLHSKDRGTKSTADGSKGGLRGTNLSIDIPVAWEYEPVMVQSHGGKKVDLRAHIENKMVDYELDFNDRLPDEMLNEVLNEEFFD